MTIPDDVAAFLGRHTRVFLLTRRRDGSPTIHPMTGFFADGRITMSTYRKSSKARNVERDPRAACLVVNGYGKSEARGVLVRGHATIRQATGAEAREGARGPSEHGREAAARTAATSGGPGGAPVSKVSDGIAARVAERMASGKRVHLDVEADEAAFVQRLWSD